MWKADKTSGFHLRRKSIQLILSQEVISNTGFRSSLSKFFMSIRMTEAPRLNTTALASLSVFGAASIGITSLINHIKS